MPLLCLLPKNNGENVEQIVWLSPPGKRRTLLYCGCLHSRGAQDIEHFRIQNSRYYQSIVMHRFKYVTFKKIGTLPILHVLTLWKNFFQKKELEMDSKSSNSSKPLCLLNVWATRSGEEGRGRGKARQNLARIQKHALWVCKRERLSTTNG